MALARYLLSRVAEGLAMEQSNLAVAILQLANRSLADDDFSHTCARLTGNQAAELADWLALESTLDDWRRICSIPTSALKSDTRAANRRPLLRRACAVKKIGHDETISSGAS